MSVVDAPDWSTSGGSATTVADGALYDDRLQIVGGKALFDHYRNTPLLLDTSGRLFPIAPQLSSGLVTVGTSNTSLAPVGGQWLCFLDVLSSVSGDTEGRLVLNGATVAAWEYSAPGSHTIDLGPWPTDFEVFAIASGAGFKVVLRYTLF